MGSGDFFDKVYSSFLGYKIEKLGPATEEIAEVQKDSYNEE